MGQLCLIVLNADKPRFIHSLHYQRIWNEGMWLELWENKKDILECHLWYAKHCTLFWPLFMSTHYWFSSRNAIYIYIYIYIYMYIYIYIPASVAQLDVLSDWRPGGRGFNPRRGRQHSFVEIDHEIFSTVILSLPLIQEGQLSVSGERMCTILVNHLED